MLAAEGKLFMYASAADQIEMNGHVREQTSVLYFILPTCVQRLALATIYFIMQ